MKKPKPKSLMREVAYERFKVQLFKRNLVPGQFVSQGELCELLDVPRGPLPDAETPAPVRFLPKWDNVLLAHADRSRVLPEPYRRQVIRMNGDVAQTFLVDGFVAATWRVEGARVVTEPFARLPPAARRELADESERLEAFLA